MTKFLSTLGLCKRAGKLVCGFDSVLEELKSPKSKAAGIVLACDVSEKTLKEAKYYGEKYGVPIFKSGHGMDEIKTVLNKKTGVLAVTDKGLFDLLSKQS